MVIGERRGEDSVSAPHPLFFFQAPLMEYLDGAVSLRHLYESQNEDANVHTLNILMSRRQLVFFASSYKPFKNSTSKKKEKKKMGK